jgi:hypothetical protein
VEVKLNPYAEWHLQCRSKDWKIAFAVATLNLDSPPPNGSNVPNWICFVELQIQQ